MNFDEFAKSVGAAGLSAKRCSEGHWQIRGGDFTVNVYPVTKRGMSFYINGAAAGDRGPATMDDVIAAATRPQATLRRIARPNGQGGARVYRKSSYGGAKRRMLRADPRCHWCQHDLTAETSTVDHVIPLSRGGSNGTDNLVLACKPCNRDRRDYLPGECRKIG